MKKILFFLVLVLAVALRFFKLGENPPALYWDETSLGYNAYSIATSLHDEHGELLPQARFMAFGDYKPPGYIYAAAPSVLVFGLNEFAVRLPSAIAGLIIVVATYLLTKELFGKEKIALLSAFIIGVSAWAVHFSRVAFEANLAAAFNLLGVYLFLLSRKKGWMLVLSVIFFILSFYTFNANRIIVPLLLGMLFLLDFRKQLLENKKWIIVSVIVGILLLLPSVSFLTSRESKLRFQEVSIFNNLVPVEVSNDRIAYDSGAWWAKIIHNRRVLFASDFFKHYFDNFSLRFLFTHGDVNPRLSVQVMGELYVWELPFLFLGIYWLVAKREKALLVLIPWMIIAPIPAATARETPHALRILSILPTFQIIIAYGLYYFTQRLKTRIFLLSVVCFLLSANMFYYLHDYYLHYPSDWSGEWQYGYKQMVGYVSNVQNQYDHIYVTEALGRPYIYFAFYEKFSNDKFLSEKVSDRDWFGFWDVKSLGKISFKMESLPDATGRILLVTTPGNLPPSFQKVTTIKNLAGDDVFLIAKKT